MKLKLFTSTTLIAALGLVAAERGSSVNHLREKIASAHHRSKSRRNLVGVDPCLADEECKMASQEHGMESFNSGVFDTKGCFTKNNKAFFSLGTEEEMSVPDLPGIQLRIWCDGKTETIENIDDASEDAGWVDGNGTENTKVSTSTPTPSPTKSPSSSPTNSPTVAPTKKPTRKPTADILDSGGNNNGIPQSVPSLRPTDHPVSQPSLSPIEYPTILPTKVPTIDQDSIFKAVAANESEITSSAHGISYNIAIVTVLVLSIVTW